MFQSLLARIAQALDRAGISYMVIGGQAVLLYGEPRLTRDIDITLGLDNSGLSKLLVIIHEAGLRVAVKDVDRFVQETNVLPVIDEATGIRVDFIFSFTEYERVALGRTLSVPLVRKPALDATHVRFWLSELSPTLHRDLLAEFEGLSG